MTLIVSLACKKGIVVASDGQVTVGSSGTPVRQPCRKIKKIGESTLWSGAGDVNFIQKIGNAIESLPEEIKNTDLDNFIQEILNIIHSIRANFLNRARRLYGSEGDKKAAAAATIFVSVKDSKPKIIHVDPDGNDTEVQEFGYVALGIGDTFAHTLLKNHAVKDFSIEEGKIVAYRVVKEAIEVGAYGLGEPIFVWSIKEYLERGIKRVKAVEISEEEKKAIEDTLFSLREAERELFKKKLGGLPISTNKNKGIFENIKITKRKKGRPKKVDLEKK